MLKTSIILLIALNACSTELTNPKECKHYIVTEIISCGHYGDCVVKVNTGIHLRTNVVPLTVGQELTVCN